MRPCPSDPTQADLAPADTLTLGLLRLPEKQWQVLQNHLVSRDETGALVTGDPVVDAWEREAMARVMAEDE
ncbi:MAG: hypothetical protein AMXMBFR64_45710 [Myxococcales bacterium]